MERGRAAIILSAAVTAACAGAEAPPEETSEAVGYVLIDEAARDAGRTLEGLEDADLSLPIAVQPGDAVKLVGPRGSGPALSLEVEPGEVLVVREAELSWGHGPERRRIGRDIADDRVVVVASEEVAKLVAEDVGGELVTDDRGRFIVEVPFAYEALSSIAPPDGLVEILPAPRDVERRWSDVLPDQEPPALLPHARAQAAAAHALLSREVAAGAEDRVLSAIVAPPVSCEDPVAGTWVSRSFYEGYGDWYVFSLHIGKDASDASKLVGHIDARSWSGRSETEEPAECGALPPSAWSDGFDWTVEMSATGALEGSAVRFGGTSWGTKSTRCGEAPQAGHYNLDQFSGRLVEGRFLQALNNDGGRLVDDPHVFRRISCER